MVLWRRSRILIDCGADWFGCFERLHPSAIVLTHAHPDHAGGLRCGAPCPVFATKETWNAISAPIRERIVIQGGAPFSIGGVCFEAFPVEHSLRAPAIGYRIKAGRATVFYVPDLVRIRHRHDALAGIQCYIGDGASVLHGILRRRDGHVIGHSSIRTQLDWCRKEGVPRAIFTHCGSQIVADRTGQAEQQVIALGKRAGIETSVAFDGLQLTIRG
jgi:phosphoribosyl 1,2-cyclic phosphodiesterase